MRAELDAAIRAARHAAALIRHGAADPTALEVRAKHPNDYVTSVDLAAQQAIAEVLLGAFPTHSLRGEESVDSLAAPTSEFEWIVDPLDGTTNFIHRYPVYAVSIALCVGGQVELGVVLDVPRGELFHAERGGGAFCNGRRIAVSGCTRLADAVVASSAPPRAAGNAAGDTARWAMRIGEVTAQVSALRRSGCAALDLAWTAAGRCDAQFDFGLAPWDVAAGSLLVQEAGGLVGRFDAAGDAAAATWGRECLASNVALHAALAAILGRHIQPPA